MLATARLAIAIALACALRSQLPEPPQAKTCSGRVVDETGAPLAGVGVLVGEPDELTATAALRDPTTRTDAAGRYSVTIAEPAATRELMFAIKGRACAYHVPRLNRVHFASDEVAKGEAGEVCLPPAIDLHGRVVGEDGKPIAGATVAAVDALLERFAEPIDRPTYFGSSARTSADGRFVLRGVFAAGLVVTVSARGHYSQVLRPVDRGTPLTFTLRASGTCRGRVVDADDQPLAARLWVAYEGGPPEPRSIVAGVDGTFEFTVAYAGRYRVRAAAEGRIESGESAICAAPRDDLELRLAAPTREFAVRATAADGTPITEFRAGVLWVVAPDTAGEWLGFRQPTSPAHNGVARLAKPGKGEPERGHFVVAANGYARVVGDVAWDADNPELVVHLDPEASVAGRVISADGQPLAGVRVRVAPSWQSPAIGRTREDPECETRSDADGTFRIGGLRAGDYEVSAAPSQLPPTTPFKVTVAKAEAKTGVQVPVARGTTLRGKLKGLVLDRPVRVVVDPPQRETGIFEEMMAAGSISFGATAGRHAPVNADGSFVAAGLPPGLCRLWLEVNAHPRTHMPVRISLGQLQLGEADREEEFDVAGKLQTTVRGKVTFTGLTVPTTRLVATAEFVERDFGYCTMSSSWSANSRAPLEANGEFTLRVAPGRQRIAIFDLLTGLELTDEEPLTVPTEGATCELRVELGRVYLKVPQPETPVIVTRLELRSGLTSDRQTLDGTYDQSTGILLAPGQTSVEVEVPPGDLAVIARSNAYAIGAPYDAALGRAEMTVTKDKVVEIEVPVTAPALSDRQR